MNSLFKKIVYKIALLVNNKRNEWRIGYLKYLYGDKFVVGENVVIRKGFSIIFLDNNPNSVVYLGDNVELRQNCTLTLMNGGVIEIGKGVFFNNSCSVTALNKVKIGDNTLFGEGVRIYDHNHLYKEGGLIKEQGFSIGEVSIGVNCWFGSNCVILNNVAVGNGVVVGANTTVFKSISDNVLIYNKANNIEVNYCK